MAAVCFEFLTEHCRTRHCVSSDSYFDGGKKRISEVHTGGVQGKQTFPIAFDVILFLKWSQNKLMCLVRNHILGPL